MFIIKANQSMYNIFNLFPSVQSDTNNITSFPCNLIGSAGKACRKRFRFFFVFFMCRKWNHSKRFSLTQNKFLPFLLSEFQWTKQQQQERQQKNRTNKTFRMRANITANQKALPNGSKLGNNALSLLSAVSQYKYNVVSNDVGTTSFGR